MAKMCFAGDIDTVPKMGGDQCCKNGDLEIFFFVEDERQKQIYSPPCRDLTLVAIGC